MSPEDYIVEEAFDSADSFLDALSRRDARWDPDPAQWIFRGHAEADWQLIPTALRPGTVLEFRSGRAVAPCPDHATQIEAELQLVRAFAQAVDEQGLSLPPGAEALFSGNLGARLARATHGMKAIFADGELPWPLPELQQIFALAQHHGIPTRLLDWSHHPLVAAYFAAEPAAKTSDETRLAVWGFRYTAAQNWDLWHYEPEAIHIITTQRASNPNLHAQRGLFTLVSVTASRPNDLPVVVPLDKLIESKLRKQTPRWLEEHQVDAPVLTRLTLPSNEAPKLLRLLAREDISGRLLFTGFDGAARGLKEQQYWDKPE